MAPEWRDGERRAATLWFVPRFGKGTPQVSINISNSVRNAASAIAAGLTTAAVCVSTGGCTGDDDDEGRKSSCDATPLIDVGGRIYGGLEEYTDHQGNKGCRATGAIAFLTKSDRRSRTGAGGLPKCLECEPSVEPDGMGEIRAGGGRPQAGHLIGIGARVPARMSATWWL
jgi:hypothetical protein